MREANNTIRWSASTLNALEDLPPNDIIDEVGGQYEYYAYVLADFNPIKAQEIINTCSIEQVTKAMMAQYNYNKPPDKDA